MSKAASHAHRWEGKTLPCRGEARSCWVCLQLPALFSPRKWHHWQRPLATMPSPLPSICPPICPSTPLTLSAWREGDTMLHDDKVCVRFFFLCPYFQIRWVTANTSTELVIDFSFFACLNRGVHMHDSRKGWRGEKRDGWKVNVGVKLKKPMHRMFTPLSKGLLVMLWHHSLHHLLLAASSHLQLRSTGPVNGPHARRLLGEKGYFYFIQTFHTSGEKRLSLRSRLEEEVLNKFVN